jgi:DNA polymerase-3 subunit alpha
MPAMPPFDKNQLLQMEKETTGVYISGHPLDAYADQLSKLPVNARFLESLAEEAPDGGMSWDQKVVRMGGIIAEKKLKAARSGNMMAFVQLEDMYGVTEVLVFPKVYERVSHLLNQDAPVVMTGKLSIREEESPKLLLDRVAPLSELDSLPEEPRTRGQRRGGASGDPPFPGGRARPARKLYLKLTAGQREAALRILAETPGSICVVLYMADENKAYQAPREYWVDEGYDFGALANLIGADNIVLKQ